MKSVWSDCNIKFAFYL